MKEYAGALGVSVAEFTERAIDTVFSLLDGDEEVPLLVAEYRLKKSYSKAAKGGAARPARKRRKSPPA